MQFISAFLFLDEIYAAKREVLTIAQRWKRPWYVNRSRLHLSLFFHLS